jgi:hypothetical protein
VVPTATAQGFLGIATELTTIPALAGPVGDPDTPFVNLLKNLSPAHRPCCASAVIQETIAHGRFPA